VDSIYNLRLTYPKTDPMNMVAKLLLNSLYGRFGMDDSFINTKIIPKEDYLEFEGKIKDGIIDVLELKDSYLVQYKDPDVEFETLLDNGREVHNVNIAIAAAVTAYARIHMSKWENKNNNTLPRLYYTDTDSLYFDGPIHSQGTDGFISNTELGKLKLEGVYDKALFLAPKVYALKNQDEEIIKIKGLREEAIKDNNITIDSLKLLLNKDYKLAFNQNKWFKNISLANIKILEQTYTLQVTDNKRELIYRDNDILVATKPIILK
jgi:DNA polymerase type B, organellar and viral